MSSRRPRHPELGSLDKEDSELWRRVTETVTPMRKARTPLPDPALPPPEPAPAAKKKAAGGPERQPVKKTTNKIAPSLAPIDRKLTRRIARGTRAVDARIDLHGLTQREAHARLLSFLQAARARGDRLVLVVTGKGRSDGAAEWWEEGTRGVLRRSVPEWLATPPFRAMVVGYERAHARKGGDGALYVQLRRPERPGGGR